MAKYMQDSSDIQINEVSGTDNINFSFKGGNSIDTKIGDLTDLETPTTDNLVGAINSVVESGSNTNGNWIKFADGTMICYFKQTINVAVTTAWGNMFEGQAQLHDFPSAFIETPIVMINLTTRTSGRYQAYIGASGSSSSSYTAPSNTTPGSVAVLRATSATGNQDFNVIAIGRWK